MLGLQLNHVSEKGPRCRKRPLDENSLKNQIISFKEMMPLFAFEKSTNSCIEQGRV